MRESLTEVLTGATVLTAAVGFGWYMSQSTGLTTDRSGAYELAASFRSAEGVLTGTDVRLAGVRIGSVTGLDLNAETYRAEVTFSIDENIRIPDDSVVVVATEGLLGGTFVEIVPGGSFDYLAPGDSFFSTQGAVSVIGLLTQFVSGGDGLE